MKKPDKYIYKFSFLNKIYKTIAVSDKEALAHVVYAITRKYTCSSSIAKSKLKFVQKLFHSKGEYTNIKKDFNKINELYSELHLEQAKQHELEIKEEL